MEIYPSIFVDTEGELEKKIKLLEDDDPLFHIDIADGAFVPHASFHNAGIIAQYPWKNSFELHLMIQNPDREISPWLKTPAKRIIFHWEAKEGPHTWVWGLIRKIKSAGKEVGIALNPKTSQENIYAFLKGIDLALIMGVEPGFSGQKFMPQVIQKIILLREKKFNGIIEVDGGMNSETILLVKRAGADAVAVASAIFDTPNPREAFIALKSKIKYQKEFHHSVGMTK